MNPKIIRLDYAKRRLYLASVEAMGVMLYTISHEYYRAWRWYGDGLSPKESEYALQQQVAMREVADRMSHLTNRLRRHLNGIKG